MTYKWTEFPLVDSTPGRGQVKNSTPRWTRCPTSATGSASGSLVGNRSLFKHQALKSHWNQYFIPTFSNFKLWNQHSRCSALGKKKQSWHGNYEMQLLNMQKAWYRVVKQNFTQLHDFIEFCSLVVKMRTALETRDKTLLVSLWSMIFLYREFLLGINDLKKMAYLIEIALYKQFCGNTSSGKEKMKKFVGATLWPLLWW